MPTPLNTPARSRISRVVHSKVTWALTATGSVVLAAGLVAFEPWALWVDKTVVEAVPAPAAVAAVEPAALRPAVPAGDAAGKDAQAGGDAEAARPSESAGDEASAAGAGSAAAAPAPTEPTVEYRGELITHEHGTTGTVQVLRLADGSRVLRLENLETSNGPDLKVVLSDAEVKPGRAGWHVFDDNVWHSLGDLKGNKGSQNYVIPTTIDLGDFRSVSIWCDRFNVSFGATELKRVSA